jgi:hypothetical protein
MSSRTYQKPLLSQRAAITMTKEKKNPIKNPIKTSEKLQQPIAKRVVVKKKEDRNYESRDDNVVKKE